MFRPLTLALTALLAGSSAFAQDKTAEVDRIFSYLTPGMPGCAVAVSQNGKVVVNRAYGMADLERDVPNTTNTIFDAGSNVKQFVSASVLLLVEEDRISLAEDVRKYIPELPDPGFKVTINHLLTHTSGIRDWTGMRPLTDGDPDVLSLALHQRGIDFRPGDEFAYSNSNYVLLKEVIARASGMSFTDFAQKRLFDKLGMKSSRYVVDMADLIRNRALAYEKSGNVWKQDMYFGNARGGGGLMTTPTDLLIWNDALTNKLLGAFVSEKIQEPTILNNGRKVSYGRALFLDSNAEGPVIWHSGGAAGYSSFIVRFPAQALSVAIMCNAGDVSEPGTAARRIYELFVPASVRAGAAPANAPAANAAPVVLAPAELSGRAGLFFDERTGLPMRLAVNNNTLTIADGRPLVALATDRFRNARTSIQFLSQAEFELKFLSVDRFEIRTKEGDVTRYRRAAPWTPTAADLSAYAGRYDSDEMGSVLEMVPDKGGLIMRFARNPARAMPFKPVERDAFMLSNMIVRFERDASGKITGYSYSNPVIRNIRYTRLKD